MLQAVKKVQELVANNANARITLHILSDFRLKDQEVLCLAVSGGL